LLMGRHKLKHDQMTSDLKTGMEGVAEETGIAPALDPTGLWICSLDTSLSKSPTCTLKPTIELTVKIFYINVREVNE
jgi:hypothetical protein